MLSSQLPAARSLSKARCEGEVRENIANADMSASVKAMSVSLRRTSGKVAKLLRTTSKRASADRGLRVFGTPMDIAHPVMKSFNRSSGRRIVHHGLRKGRWESPLITGGERSSGIVGSLVRVLCINENPDHQTKE